MGNLTKMGQEVRQAELLHLTTRRQLQTQQKEMHLASGYYFTVSAEGRKTYPISRSPNSPASENPLYFQLPVYSNGFFVYNCLPNLPPFLYKRTYYSFVLWTCLWFCCSLLVQDCNSFLFPNKPIFCW